MSKGPILVLGAAAVVGIAIAAKRQSAASSDAVPPVPEGKSLQDMTTTQKKKLEDWAKKKGLPVQQAYDLAKQVFSTKF